MESTRLEFNRSGLRRRPWLRNAAIATIVGGLVAATSLTASAAPVHATMTGEAYGISATLGLLGNPPSTIIAGLPDTGPVVTNVTQTVAPACLNVPAGVITLQGLCDTVKTHAYTSRIAATAALANLSINVPGLPVILLKGVKAWSTITCGSSHGTTTIALLKIGGKTIISRGATFSNGETLNVGPIQIVINSTTRTGPPSRSRTVTALHITADVPNVADLDVVVSYATAKVDDCPVTDPTPTETTTAPAP